MKKKANDVKKLFAANLQGKVEVEHFDRILDERFKEYALFLKRMQRLRFLCWHIDVPVKGKDSSSLDKDMHVARIKIATLSLLL